jgi:hypothetical protein
MVLLVLANEAKQKYNRHCEHSEAIRNTPHFLASLTTGLPRDPAPSQSWCCLFQQMKRSKKTMTSLRAQRSNPDKQIDVTPIVLYRRHHHIDFNAGFDQGQGCR